jgi:cysteine desulfuration protein SufE
MARDEFEDLVDTFAFLDDWEDRYRHVIDMGRKLPPLDEAERVPATKVEGCASQVWLVPEIEGAGDDATLRFRGESDAMIVKGLIAVLQTLYNGLTVQEAREIDAAAELGRLSLQEHLSSQRSNGLKAMVGRIREIAARA